METSAIAHATAEDAEAVADGSTSASAGADAENLKETPRARRHAKEHGVDLTAVEGTGL